MIRILAKTKFVEDPIAGVKYSRATSIVSSAVAGLEDDTRILQISAPVQPGNSGGPLLDYSGNVVGVVEGKLNAITVFTVTDDLAQNVNFAIKANVVTSWGDWMATGRCDLFLPGPL
jgi:S1-C subfamily serine protease